MSILPPTEGLENSWGWGGGGSQRPKTFRKCMKLIGIFQRGGGVMINSFHRGGMDNFWNYTIKE